MAQRFVSFDMQVGLVYSRYAEAVADGVEQLAERWARAVQAEARRLSPKNTGRLQRSISISLSRTHDEIAAVVGTNCRHAPFVEFGTSRIRVGTPETPRTMWYTKAKKGPRYPNPSATMPYLRTAERHIESSFLAQLRKIGKEVA